MFRSTDPDQRAPRLRCLSFSSPPSAYQLAAGPVMTAIRPSNIIGLRAITSALPARPVAAAGVGHVPGWTVLSAGLAPVLLISAWVAADARQPHHYSPMRQTVSVLSGHAGTDRWLMTGGLLLVSACYFVTATGLRHIPAVAGILVVTGVAAVGVAVCPQPAVGSTAAAHAVDCRR